jgi:hypothetical protein
MNKFLVILLFFLSISIFAQTNNPISKEKYDFLTDSLSSEKANLLTEKEFLLSKIDSLKNLLVELEEKWNSSRKNQLVKKYGKNIAVRISNGQVWKGMSEKMLEDSWGKPDKITKNKEKWGVFTQWYYGSITYYFKDRIMTDWEEKK